MKNPTVVRCRDAGAAAAFLANRMREIVETAPGGNGSTNISFCGGETPTVAYGMLPALVGDWHGVHVWFGDERCVGPHDPLSNYAMLKRDLIDRIEIPSSNVHRMRGEDEPGAAARAYAEEIGADMAYGADGVPVFDLHVLGVGEDGHTASLFPGSPTLDETDAVCVPVYDSPKEPRERVTLTLPVISAAHRVLFLVTGARKARAVAHMVSDPDPEWPASLVDARDVEIVLDAEAAAGLDRCR